LDTIPDKEFVGIFRRNAKYINLKGAWTPQELDERLKVMQFRMMQRAIDESSQFTKWWKKARLIKRLREHGFPRRVIDEAMADQHGIYALTLRYGYKRAVEIMLERGRSRIRGRINRRRQ
jgi:hypothetical protein